jgi:RNA polymerase sigma-70 factor, ECF subfamily
MAIAPAPEPADSASRLGEIYARYSRSLWGYLYRAFCRADPDCASDLMQEIFVRVLSSSRSIAEAETEEQARNWLFQLARRVAIDAHRKRHAHRRDAGVMVSLTDAQAQQIAAAGDPLKSDDVLAVLEQLDRLPDLHREILLLKEGGHSFDEIAAITGRTVASVKLLRQKAIDRIKKALD